MKQIISKRRGAAAVIGGFFKDRTARALLLAAILAAIMGSLRPDKSEGMSGSTYWARKMQWKQKAGAVLTGDSRVLMAVAPEIMEQYLDYEKILNYAFGANWYCAEYMDATEKLLVPGARKKAIIMGFSPHTLTWRTKGMGHFVEMSRRPQLNRYLETHAGWFFDLLEPMSLRDAFHGLFPSMAPTQTVKDYRESGWIAVHKSPGDEDHEVKRYRGIYRERQVSSRTIAGAMKYVSRWSRMGIKVYGFVPPTCEGMVELERTASGFNKEHFVAEFEKAGGVWLEVNPTGYYSFDGSHLQNEGAIAFSHDLAKMIQKQENGGKVARSD